MPFSRVMIVGMASLTLASCRNGTGPKSELGNATHPTGNTDTRILGFSGRPFGLNVTSAGDVLTTEQDMNQAVRVDSLGGNAVGIAVGHDPGDVITTRDGATAFVSGFFDGTVSVVTLSNNRVTTIIPVSTNAYRLVLSSSGADLYVTSTDGNLYDVSTSSRTVSRSVPLGGSQGIAINHAGSSLYVSSTSGTVWRLNLPALTIGTSVTQSCSGQEVALSTDDAELYFACEDGKVLVLDPTSLALKATIPVSSLAPFGMAVSPDNQQIYVAGGGGLAVIDRASRTVIKQLALGGTPRRVGFNKTGNKAYISNEGNWVDVIE
jgi:hyaluronoglucosaminidase